MSFDSINGTRLNGRRLVRCKVRPGDVLRLGRERLRVS